MADVVVVDASAVIDTLLSGRYSFVGMALAAPAHLDAEVLSALGRLHRQGVLSADDVDEMLDDLAALAVHRLALPPLLGHAFMLRDLVSLRDALYVVVARALDAPLLTSDERLSRSCFDRDLCSMYTA